MKLNLWKCGLLVVVMALAACGRDASYLNALPKDAAMVGWADFASMAGKAGLQGNAGGQATERLEKFIGKQPGELGAFIRKICTDTEGSGLDFKEKVYVYAEAQAAQTGVLFRMADKDKADALMEALAKEGACDEVSVRDGYTWTMMGKTLVVYDDKAMLLIMPCTVPASSADLLRAGTRQLRQEAENSFMATDDFDTLQAEKGDAAVWVTADCFPLQLLSIYRMSLPAGVEPGAYKAVISVTFEKGQMAVNLKNAVTDKALREVLKKGGKIYAPLKGKTLESFPANTFLWAAVNWDGSKMYDLLCENPAWKQQLENPMIPVDFKAILCSFNGELAVAVPYSLDGSFIACAEITDDRFMQTFEDLKPLLALTGGQMRLLDRGPGAYELRTSGRGGYATAFSSIWLGVSGNRFYVTNREELVNARVPGLTLKDTPWGRQVAGNCFFAGINMDPVAGLAGSMKQNGTDEAALLGATGIVDYFSIGLEDMDRGFFNMVMKDKTKNALQSVWEALN